MARMDSSSATVTDTPTTPPAIPPKATKPRAPARRRGPADPAGLASAIEAERAARIEAAPAVPVPADAREPDAVEVPRDSEADARAAAHVARALAIGAAILAARWDGDLAETIAGAESDAAALGDEFGPGIGAAVGDALIVAGAVSRFAAVFARKVAARRIAEAKARERAAAAELAAENERRKAGV